VCEGISVNKSNHPIQNPLLLVTEPWTCDNVNSEDTKRELKIESVRNNTEEYRQNWMNHLIRMKEYQIRFYRINQEDTETKEDLRKDGTNMQS
jgi:hypothetical protein